MAWKRRLSVRAALLAGQIALRPTSLRKHTLFGLPAAVILLAGGLAAAVIVPSAISTPPCWSKSPNKVCPPSSTTSTTSSATTSTTSSSTISSTTSTTSTSASSTDTTPPTVPTGLALASATASSLSLAWSASTDNVGVAGYGIYLGATLVGTTATTAYAVSSLTCGTSYTISVDAFDAAGNRSAKSTVTAATSACGDATAPSAPTGLVVSGSTSSSVSLSWSASTDNVGVAGYAVYQGSALVANSTTTSYTVGGLACGSSYGFQVDAYDASGNRSAKSAVLTASTAACSSASSANVFVSASGSDAAACTQSAPCKSFDRAYHVAQPGQMVEVAAGSYPSQTVNVDSSKTSSADVVFRPAAGASVSLSYVDVYGSHLELRGFSTGGWYVHPGADDVTMREISSSGQIFITSASNISVIGGTVDGSGRYWTNGNQIKTASSTAPIPTNILFDGVTFRNWLRDPSSSDHVDCLHVMAGDGITVRNSRFANCEAFDILFTMYLGPTPTNVLVENDFFDCCKSGYYAVYLGGGHGENYKNYTIRNNSSDQSITVCTDCTISGNIQIYANIAPSSTSGLCGRSGISVDYNVWGSGSRCGSHDLIAASGFTDPANLDFHLKDGAAAIGHGNPAAFPATDIDGQSRPQGTAVDAGADERT